MIEFKVENYSILEADIKKVESILTLSKTQSNKGKEP